MTKKSTKIAIGESAGHVVAFDLDLLIVTNLLVQANSGGGKSWAIRRLVEQAFGKIQIVILDPEGEFSSLREKFDFVLAGAEGETVADHRSAALLAERLLELKASCICDIFEMNPQHRHQFVKNFLDALINAAKKLWHPVLVIVDEAHVFAPEKGQGESLALESMRALASRGRKRGFCAVWATQRLSKLDKTSSSELKNRLIGPTFEDLDLDRAVKTLSISDSDKNQFKREMKVIDPGYFYALGRAITKERLLVKIGPVETTHPDIGSGKTATYVPPTPDAVRNLLPQLADLPKEAEAKAKSMADLQQEIRTLKAQLKAQPKIEADPAAVERQVEAAVAQALKTAGAEYQAKANGLLAIAKKQQERLQYIADKALEVATAPLPEIVTAKTVRFTPPTIEGKRQLAAIGKPATMTTSKPWPDTKPTDVAPSELSRPQRDLLRALAESEAIGRDAISRSWLAFLAGVSPKSSGFEKNVSTLSSKGLVGYPQQGKVALTPEGRSIAGSVDSVLDTDEMFARVYRMLSGPQELLLNVLRRSYPHPLSREDLAAKSGCSPLSSGYEKNVSTLSSRELVTYPDKGMVRCADWLFIE